MTRRRSRSAHFAGRIAQHVPFIRRLAHRLSRGEADLADDLRQEGLIAIWELKRPLQVDAAGRLAVERAVITRRMLRFLRQFASARATVEPEWLYVADGRLPTPLTYQSTVSAPRLCGAVDVEWSQLRRSGLLTRSAMLAGLRAYDVWQLSREDAIIVTVEPSHRRGRVSVTTSFVGADGDERERARAQLIATLWRALLVPQLRRRLGRSALEEGEGEKTDLAVGARPVLTAAA